MSTSLRCLSVVVLLLLGLAGWRVLFGEFNSAFVSLGSLGPNALGVFVLIVVGIALIPPVAGPLDRLFGRVRHWSPRARLICSVISGIASAVYLYATAMAEHRQFFPYIHDEFSYLIQAHQLARGKLWMAGHPMGQFFDSFQLFTKSVYASAYFPGTALLYVPGVWLHLPPFVTSLIIAGAVAGLMFWITAELLDPVAAVLALLLLLSDGIYRQLSIVTLAQMPLLLYALLAVVAWLRWGVTQRIGWAVAIGFFLGLAAITRPVDALCFAIPIGIAFAANAGKNLNPPDAETQREEIDPRMHANGHEYKKGIGLCFRFVCIRVQAWMTFFCFRACMGCYLALAAGALPFLCMQLIADRGITGHWLQTPFGLYADRDYPGTSYGFHSFDPTAQPVSDVPQKIALYRNEYLSLIKHHQIGHAVDDLLRPHGPFNAARISMSISQSSPTPFPLLALLLPVALLGCTGKRWVILITLPLFWLLYIPYPFFFQHYALAVAPAVILGILTGAKVLNDLWPTQRRPVSAGITLMIAGLAIAALPQWSPLNEDIFTADLLANLNQQLAGLPHRPAVVLFTYDPKRNTHEEPVYNADVAWPDEAEIIHAHDRGPQNQQMFDYYAKHQPDRYFYRFDERDRTLYELGSAAQLASHS